MTAAFKGALIARINRKLAHDGERLRTTRGMHARIDLGDHYIADVRSNYVVARHVDIDGLARELGLSSEVK